MTSAISRFCSQLPLALLFLRRDFWTQFYVPVSMNDFAGLAVPRRTHASDLSHDERAFEWVLLIESGHIPLRTRLGTCSRDLYRPLRLRFLGWLFRVAFGDILTLRSILRAS